MVFPRVVGLTDSCRLRAVSCQLLHIPRALLIASILASAVGAQTDTRPRARDIGIVVGILPPGPNNAITDVSGVRVGHMTVTEGDTINTGVTAILPHAGNVYRDRVPAAAFVLNGYGKTLGLPQVQELGELETPILLTCTLCVWRAADAFAEHLLAQPGMENVRSLNVVVGETNDGRLNDIRLRPISARHVVAALQGASDGPVAEGSVGAGTGTSAFGWKGGIGTSSRRLPESVLAGGYTVGVLVQSNFGGVLTINGAPVGRELGRYPFAERLRATSSSRGEDPSGSIMIVVATDAPLSSTNLERLARRAALGLARTGSYAGNGSGDFIIAFSTAESVRRRAVASPEPIPVVGELSGDRLDPLFLAIVEATEEAIYNSLLKATPVTYRGRMMDALPIAETLRILEQYGVVRRRGP